MFNKSKEKSKKREHNKGQVFTRIMAAILVVSMLSGTVISLIYALLQG